LAGYFGFPLKLVVVGVLMQGAMVDCRLDSVLVDSFFRRFENHSPWLFNPHITFFLQFGFGSVNGSAGLCKCCSNL